MLVLLLNLLRSLNLPIYVPEAIEPNGTWLAKVPSHASHLPFQGNGHIPVVLPFSACALKQHFWGKFYDFVNEGKPARKKAENIRIRAGGTKCIGKINYIRTRFAKEAGMRPSSPERCHRTSSFLNEFGHKSAKHEPKFPCLQFQLYIR